ncbi:MAG: hypothetical protein OEV06_03985 [Anaerolineae bacterium]|nr:hypothetical protein [Anaerolineae bacterium]
MKHKSIIIGLTASFIVGGCVTINVPDAELNVPTLLPQLEDLEKTAEAAIPELLDNLEDLEITFDSETYVDEAAGFDLEIPSDWYEGAVETLERGYSTTFQSFPATGGDAGVTSGGDPGDPPDDDPDGDGNGEPDVEGDGDPDGDGEGEPAGQSDGEGEPAAVDSILTIEVLDWTPANNMNAFRDHWLAIWADAGTQVLAKEEWNINLKRRAILYVLKTAEGETTFFFFTELKDQYLVLSGSGELTVLVEIARSVNLRDY